MEFVRVGVREKKLIQLGKKGKPLTNWVKCGWCFVILMGNYQSLRSTPYGGKTPCVHHNSYYCVRSTTGYTSILVPFTTYRLNQWYNIVVTRNPRLLIYDLWRPGSFGRHPFPRPWHRFRIIPLSGAEVGMRTQRIIELNLVRVFDWPNNEVFLATSLYRRLSFGIKQLLLKAIVGIFFHFSNFNFVSFPSVPLGASFPSLVLFSSSSSFSCV